MNKLGMIDVWVGLKQGCPISPALFSLLFDRVYKQIYNECADEGRTRLSSNFIRLLALQLWCLLLADDLILFSDWLFNLRK